MAKWGCAIDHVEAHGDEANPSRAEFGSPVFVVTIHASESCQGNTRERLRADPGKEHEQAAIALSSRHLNGRKHLSFPVHESFRCLSRCADHGLERFVLCDSGCFVFGEFCSARIRVGELIAESVKANLDK
jgi:hypothetical protein